MKPRLCHCPHFHAHPLHAHYSFQKKAWGLCLNTNPFLLSFLPAPAILCIPYCSVLKAERCAAHSALHTLGQPRTTNNKIEPISRGFMQKKVIASKVSNLWRCISDNEKDWEKGVHHQDFVLCFPNLRVLFFFHGRFFVFLFLATKLFQWGYGISFLHRDILSFGIFWSKHAGPALHHSVRLLMYHCLHQIMACYCWLHQRNNFLKHVEARK